MKSKKILIPVAVLGAAIIAWAFIGRDHGGGVSYRLVEVERGSLEAVVTSTGTLEATETIEVGTQVSGQIAQLFVDFNDRVAKGQLLARIDPTILQQEVQAAEANVLRNRAELEQSEKALARNRELIAQKVITAAEFEQAEYAYTVARAAHTSAQVGLERARRNLAYTEIRAPIDGVVVERTGDVGQTVAASMSAPTLFLIAQDLSQMQILASVDESDIGKIEQGQEVRFTVQAYGEQEFTGRVEQVRLQSKTQDNVVSYSVVIRVDNESGRLLPGMTATVKFVVARADDVLRVANSALRFQPSEEERTAALAALRAQRTAGGAVRPTAQGARGGDAAARPRGAANRGMLWITGAQGTLQVVTVRTGLTDGQTTEISGEGVTEGMQVIAGVASGPAQQNASNPFDSRTQSRPGPRMF